MVPAVLSTPFIDYSLQPLDVGLFKVVVESLQITRPRVEIELVPAERPLMDNTVSIKINRKVCHYFPRGFHNYFVSIRAIFVHQSQLKVITKYDLEPFPQLLLLSLQSNQLTNILPKTFISNTGLKRIYLNDNRISEISVDIFDYFEDEVDLELMNNDCIKHEGTTYRLNSNQIMREITANCQLKTRDQSEKYIAMHEAWLESVKDPKELRYLSMIIKPTYEIYVTLYLLSFSISFLIYWKRFYRESYAVGG